MQKYSFITIVGVSSILVWMGSLSVCDSASIMQPPIITRSQRGANEALRRGRGGTSTSSTSQNQSGTQDLTAQQKRQIADRYLIQNFGDEFRVDTTIKTWNNKSLLWPVALNNSKFKLIIHHTARSPVSNLYSDVLAELQDIYLFHTVNRKRGDIGYNYIIGPNGEIFEGRAGGPSAVGAHAVNNNGGSIGVSLMGNFDITKPSAAQLESLIQLTTRLAQNYNIDVNQQVIYHTSSDEDPYIVDHSDHSLVGHKDAGDTSCPGYHLYIKLSTIRSQIASRLTSPIPQDLTPVVTDPTQYYIPHSSYQLTIPRSTTSSISTCTTSSTQRTLAKCVLKGDQLTLHLNKINNTSHQGSQRIIITHGDKKYYLIINLEYNTFTTSNKPIVSIPSTPSYYTGSTLDVLLYHLSTTQNLRNVSCEGGCVLRLNTLTPLTLPAGTKFQVSKPVDTPTSPLVFWRKNNQYPIDSLMVSAIGTSSIKVTNYARRHNSTQLNQRKGTLSWSMQEYKPIGKPIMRDIIISNRVRIDDYLRGIITTDLSNPQSYHDTMLMIAHTNARYRSNYLTDDPRIHQYYGGSQASTINPKRQLSNDLYHQTILKNNTQLTYAPVFECSDGRTRNGVNDLGVCNNGQLSGNGIGLSKAGALVLAQRGYSARQIIEYYFPGITISTLP